MHFVSVGNRAFTLAVASAIIEVARVQWKRTI
jgi:hypothetical protein